ncbi:MAG: ABC transporter permease [Synergistales bacterium]|nr:ABC transporter permease [Synergistales bacterium]
MDIFTEYISSHSGQITTAIWQHIYLFAISLSISIVIGMALSIFITAEGREKIGKFVLAITGAAQSVPSVAVVALVFIFVGIGAPPAIIALVIYSLVPVVFNATSGILNVDQGIIEAARGMGFTNTQILWRIKIPLAMTIIMSGIRSAAMINIGTVTVAAFIGAGGLGDLIFTGLKMNRFVMIFVGGSLSALIAITVDTILMFVEQRIIPKGLQVSR